MKVLKAICKYGRAGTKQIAKSVFGPQPEKAAMVLVSLTPKAQRY